MKTTNKQFKDLSASEFTQYLYGELEVSPDPCDECGLQEHPPECWVPQWEAELGEADEDASCMECGADGAIVEYLPEENHYEAFCKGCLTAIECGSEPTYARNEEVEQVLHIDDADLPF